MDLAEWIKSVASQPWQFLLMLNIALLLLGIFIEPLPAMLLTAPLFLPMAQAMGIDLILMGVIMVMNLSIALYTPPVGGTLFVAAEAGGGGNGERRRRWIRRRCRRRAPPPSSDDVAVD